MTLPIRFMDWPLRTKVAALFLVISLLPLGIGTWISIRETRERMELSTAALLASSGDQLVQRLDTFHAAYNRSACHIAHLPDIIAFCRAGTGESDRFKGTVHDLLSIWCRSDSRIRGVAILDVSGTVIFSTEAPLAGVDLSYRTYVKDALSGRSAVSDIHLAEVEVNHIPTVAYLFPVRGPGEEVVGAVNISVRASAFWDIMRQSDGLAGPGSYAVLFDSHGIRLGHTSSDDVVFHPAGRLDPAVVDAIVDENRFGVQTRRLLEEVRPFAEQFVRARAESPDAGVFHGFSPTGSGWTYGIARRFQTVPWTVFYMIPERALDAQIAGMTRQKTAFGGVIIFIALISGTLCAAVVLKPIRQLTRATELIAADDLSARVPAVHFDELGRLGSSFNAMAARIETQAAALRRSHGKLEARVQERTAELLQTTQALEAEAIERRQADEAVRKSEAQLHTVLQSLDEGIVVSDLDGRIQHFNRAAVELHGFSRPEEYLRQLAQFTDTLELSGMDGAVWPVDQWPLARVLRGEKLRCLDVHIRKHDSDWNRVFSYGGTLVRNPDGRPLMAILTITDITERQRSDRRRRAAEEIGRLNTELERRVEERTAQLQAVNAELEAFSYSVSHDLRAPLRSLDGFSLALIEDCAAKLNPEELDSLKRIRAASQRMGQLIDDLLNLSRITRTEMVRQSVDLSRLAQTVVDELRAADPGSPVEFSIAPGLVVEGDPRMLRIALTNLFSNAWKFSAKSAVPRVAFGCAVEDGERVFFVRDNGVGFDMAHVGKLFSAFQRLHAMHEFPGTGIGLVIVQRIVRKHGGRIWAQSTPDAGATFRFTL